MHGSFQGKKLGFIRYNGELESTVRLLALFSMTRGRIVPIVGLCGEPGARAAPIASDEAGSCPIRAVPKRVTFIGERFSSKCHAHFA